MARPRQRAALAALFVLLTLAFVAVAVFAAWGASGSVRRWVIAGASVALAAWLASLARQLIGRH